MKTKKRVIIYAGVKSTTWEDEAYQLKEVLEKEGYKVLDVIPINGLQYPKIEYLREEK